jgi:hypothetical protein
MTRNANYVYCLLFLIFFSGGCTSIPRYQLVTDSGDREQYQVVGRVLSSFHKPVSECQIYLTRRWPTLKRGLPSHVQYLPVAVTDTQGNYSFNFELEEATEFYLYFDARLQGYQARSIDITDLFTSHMWQYTGNNPVVANAILIPENIAIERDFEQE